MNAPVPTAPVPTAADEARWAPLRAIAVAQARRSRVQDWRATAAAAVAGLLVVGAAIAAVMTMPLLTVIITGGLIVLALVLALMTCWLIDRSTGRAELFGDRERKPTATHCACGGPLAARAPEPAAAAAEPAPATVPDGVPPASVPALEPPSAAPAQAAPPLPPHSPDWPMHQPAAAPVPEPPGSVLARAARLLPPDFDPSVDSMVDGIPPVTGDADGQIRDGEL